MRRIVNRLWVEKGTAIGYTGWAMKRLRVVVLWGGPRQLRGKENSEREVSRMSASEVLRNLDKKKYGVEMVEMGERDWVEKLKTAEVVFIAMHGKYGEDGRIQGLLDCLKIPYIGSGVLASAIGMDKEVFRKLMEREKVLMPRLSKKIPCVVKPVDQGSSVGVSVVKEKTDLKKAIEKAKRYSDRVIIEEYIEGTEVSCGILKGKALPVIEICPKKEFFDYEAKYTAGKCEEIVPAFAKASTCSADKSAGKPARYYKSLTERIQKTALKVFRIVRCKGLARVDMIIRKGKIYVLEINTIPGLTANSLLPKEAKAAGISYGQLLDRIVSDARIV